LLTKENDGFGAYGWILRYLRGGGGWAITKTKNRARKKDKARKKFLQG